MLVAKSLVGSENENAVEFLCMMLLGIIQILLDIDMQHQGLSRTRGTPECQFVQVVVGELWHFMPCLESEVELIYKKAVDVIQQSNLVGEISVEIYLSEQQCQILVVFPCNLFCPSLVYLFGIFHDMPVIFTQFLFADANVGIKILLQRIKHSRASLIVHPLQCRV